MQVRLPIDRIFDEQPDVQKFLDEGFAVDRVIWKGLSFELLGRTVESAVVIGKVPACDEE